MSEIEGKNVENSDVKGKSIENSDVKGKMKAVMLTKYIEDLNENNIKDGLEIKMVDIPEVTSSTILVKIYAASINPIDWKILKGFVKQIMRSPPLIPGFDFAGEVVKVGHCVKNFREGDRVFGMSGVRELGAYAEYGVFKEDYLSHMPHDMTYNEAATIPLAATTSYRALITRKNLKPNSKVLILGGSGGAGVMGIQIAKAYDCKVYCTASARNSELLKSLGADEVINYREEKWWEKLKGEEFDTIYDCVGGKDSWLNSNLVLKPKGNFVTIAGDEQDGLDIGKLLKKGGYIASRKFWSLFGYNNYDYFTNMSSSIILNDVRGLINKKNLRAVVEKEFQFDDFVEFYAHSIRGHTVGKTALVICSEKMEKDETA